MIEYGSGQKVLKELLAVKGFGKAPVEIANTLKRVMVIDTEATQVNPREGDLAEIAFSVIEFDMNGNFYDILFKYEGQQEVKKEFDENATILTGLTKEDLIGKHIDWELVKSMIEKVDVIVAFNASFDRQLLERYCPAFENKFWVCAMEEVSWIKLFKTRGSQEFLVQNICGLYYGSHRAMIDVDALSVLLNQQTSEGTVFYHMLKKAAQKKYRVYADNAPFKIKDTLSADGYRWNGDIRVWYKETTNKQEELDYLLTLGVTGSSIEINGFNKYR